MLADTEAQRLAERRAEEVRNRLDKLHDIRMANDRAEFRHQEQREERREERITARERQESDDIWRRDQARFQAETQRVQVNTMLILTYSTP